MNRVLTCSKCNKIIINPYNESKCFSINHLRRYLKEHLRINNIRTNIIINSFYPINGKYSKCCIDYDIIQTLHKDTHTKTVYYMGNLYDNYNNKYNAEHAEIDDRYKEIESSNKRNDKYKLDRYKDKKVDDLFKYGGYCWICGELDITLLEKHHFVDDFKIHLCSNCHHKYKIKNQTIHRFNIGKRLEKVI